MNHRIATLAAFAIIGSSALGLETLAVSRVARGATAWFGSPEALAFGHAGRIAGESLGRVATDQAREMAFDATLGVVRGLSAIYQATGSQTFAVPAVSTRHEIRIHRLLKSAGNRAEFSLDENVDLLDENAVPPCPNQKADRTTS